VELRKWSARRADQLSRATPESASSWLADEILAKLETALSGSLEEASVNVRISDERPYVVEVDVFARTKYPYKELERVLQRIVDEAFKEFEARWQKLKQGSNSGA